MSNCKFSHLQIGEPVTLIVEGGSCECGEPSVLIGKDVTALYYGHITDGEVYDKFKIIGYYRCPSCNQEVEWYHEICRAGGVWVFANQEAEYEQYD